MSFPRYPAYKDSGVEWLGEVPGHWAIPQIKRTTYLKARVGWKGLTSEEFREKSFAYLVTGSDFREKFVKWDACYQVEQDRYEDDPFIQLKNGDLLITKDGTIGKLAIVSNLDRPACLNSGIFVVRPLRTYTTEFMYWVLSSSVFSVFCDLESFGSTINHLYQNVFEQFEFPAPPESEQTQIAAFLDSETAKIDALVAEQRRLMALLKEKRQAVISHAVTRGLNPDASMKPSGIEWLGDVPAHWSTPAMYMRYSSELGKMLDSAKITGQHLIPYMRNVDVQWGVINFDDLPEMDIPVGEYERYVVKSGDLLVCEGGEVGRAAIVPPVTGIFGYQKALHRLRALDTSEDSRFMYFTLLWAANTGIFDQSGSSTIAHLTGEQLRKYRFPKPPVSEQKAIAQYLEAESAKFDTLTTEAQRAIDLLQERRTALISAAVTGQIDVRGAHIGAMT